MGSNNVTVVRERDGSFKMSFISGSVINVPGEPGARIISPPCGDGKSTMIKKIMSEYFPYGVLVSVGTIEEAEDYANYVRENIVGKESFGVRMTNERLIVLHSGNEDKHAEYIYSSNPVEIMDKYIVICTHHKLLNNDPRILVQVNKEKFPIIRYVENRISSLGPKPYDYGGFILLQALGRMDYYGPSPINMVGLDGIPRRQFILVDEMPRCSSIRWIMKRAELSLLLMPFIIQVIDNKTYDKTEVTTSTGEIKEVPIVSDYKPSTYVIGRCNDLNDVIDSYNLTIRGTSMDPISGTRAIDELNRRFLIESLFLKLNEDNGVIFENPITMSQIPDKLSICYNLSTLAGERIGTRLWVFDGTGDLSFHGIKNFKLCLPGIPSDPKFKSDVSFKPIHITSTRSRPGGKLTSSPDRIIDELNENVFNIMNVFKKSPDSKFLIVSWKTLCFRRGSRSSNVSSLDVLKSYVTMTESKHELDLTRYYKDRLDREIELAKGYGFLGENFEYSIIHYQSGLDRATNRYRNYDSVILFGKFMLPYEALDEHNLLTGSNTDLTRLTIQGLVQAICRTRIRNHQGEPITVYYSDDWDERIIKLTKLYMENKSNFMRSFLVDFTMGVPEEALLDDRFINNLPELDDADPACSGWYGLNPSWRKKLHNLIRSYPDMKDSILNGIPYTLNISLDDLYNLVPMSRKEKYRYERNLGPILGSLGVTLNIV